jgi:hypothetical protein
MKVEITVKFMAWIEAIEGLDPQSLYIQCPIHADVQVMSPGRLEVGITNDYETIEVQVISED